MAYCYKCGAYISDLAEKCPSCGARKVKDDGAGGTSAAAAAPPPQEEKKPESEYSYTYNNTRAREAAGSSYSAGAYAERMDADAQANKGLGVLCYLGVFLLIPLLLKPDSKFLRYHCNQGLLMFLLGVLTGAVWNIPIIGWIAGLAGSFLSVVCFFKGISNALSGRCEPLPYIGGISLIK